ncbi:hypothetical protein [uncultured Lacinutrix sp.]|uniref:hypothetical protein n=1 Tax=uncultured Lacinutrix sp. TaxID=574032 RepID=UPI002629DAA5|nr:hypothetical protein [uncultured Lacinutrix sp.]
MKKTFLLVVFFMLSIIGVSAQSPQKINYQAIIKDANGDAVSNQNISLQININESTSNGTTVYTETHTVTTSPDGLVVLAIGDGNTTDDFTTLSWGSTAYFLNVAVDLNAGTTYSDMGTQQLVSVPYALTANTAEHAEKLESENGNLSLIANNGNLNMRIGFSEVFDFSNSKMRLSTTNPNFGNNLQLEFKDDSNINTIANVFPNVASLPAPGNVDYRLNLNVRGNETLSARGDGSVRINNSYTLPNTDGNEGQVLVTNGGGTISWGSSTKLSDTDGDTQIQVEETNDEDIIRFDIEGAEYFKMEKGRLETLNNGLSVFIGENAGANDDLTANENVAVGFGALQQNVNGDANTSVGAFSLNALTNGGANTAIGIGALESSVHGSNNVAIGVGALSTTVGSASTGAGDNNVAIGYRAGLNSRGRGNVFLGANTDLSGLTSNMLIIDNTNTTSPLIEGNFGTNDLKVNGTFQTTSHATVNGNVTATGTTTTSSLKIGSSSTLSGIYKVSVSRNVGNIGGNSSRIETFTVTGASPGDVVFVSPSENLQSQVVVGQAWVSSNNTVSVRFRNTDGGSQDPDGSNGATYYISVIK